MPKRSVLLVDDHSLIRAALRSLIESTSDLQVVAEAEDTMQALEMVRTHQPDIALVDISMPGLSGIEFIKRLKKRWPEVRAIVLSMHKGKEYVVRAMKAGANGYLMKDVAVGELKIAIDRVFDGGTYLCEDIASVLEDGAQEDPLTILTSRQREILQLVAQSKSTKEIAAELFISVKTVETHRAELMRRLGTKDVAGLVRFAISSGLVPIDEN